MAINYNRLWKLLIDNNMKKQDLKLKAGLSKGTITKLGKNEDVSTQTLSRICEALNCDIGDIIEFENDKIKEQK